MLKGKDGGPFIIAELSGNHNGDISRCKRLIDAAAAAGADAVKLQTYTADTITIDCDKPDFVARNVGSWDGQTLYDLYSEAQTPWSWLPELFDYSRAARIPIFSSPFDESAVDLLEDLGCAIYKVASFELVDIPLIRYIARLGKPMILSTGMATVDEIADAVETIGDRAPIFLLKCTSSYPAPVSAANLATIPDMATRFGVPVGLSDHTLGGAVTVAAVALGAQLIEKHLTLSRADGGPDSGFSMEPREFADMVAAARDAHRAIGSVSYGPQESEMGNRLLRRSLYAVEDIARGEPFTRRNVRSIRPGHGLPPKELDDILGRPARVAIERGTALKRGEHV